MDNDAHLQPDGFRLRGTRGSRIDAFSDVVFGFALTLLVVSPEVPKTYAALHQLLRGFVPFAISFTFLVMIWFAHFRLFRRFGLHDNVTIVLNAVLLFVVLFFVYPLKFLFTMMLGGTDPNAVFQTSAQVRELMVVYGVGFAAVYTLLALLYGLGWRQREHLELNAVERALTVSWIEDCAGVACVGLLSALVAVLLPPHTAGYAGFTFFLIVPFKVVHGWVCGKSLRLVRAEYDRVQYAAAHDRSAGAPAQHAAGHHPAT